MSQQKSKTITILPLQIQWQGQSPIYRSFSAHSLRKDMNMYFEKRNKNIRIRQVSYEQIKSNKVYFYEQNENFVNYENYQAVGNQKHNNENSKSNKQIQDVYQQMRISNLLFVQNINAFADIYLYSKTNVYLTSTASLINRCPRFQNKIKALIEIPRQEYDNYDSFSFRIEKDHDSIILRHPSEHNEYQKVKKIKKPITNWTISFEPSSQIISHFVDFDAVTQLVSKINSNIEIKTFIFHQNSESFQIISQIFNGIVFKFTIKNSNVKYCRLSEQNKFDTFYFSLLQEPEVYAVVQDWKVSNDIEYQNKWLPFPSFLNSCKSYSFRNHFVFNQYFMNSNVISIKTEKLSQTSVFFRGFCYKIKQRFHILDKPMTQISILKIIHQLNENYYEQMIGNMFINPDIKSQLVFLLRELMISGQLSMIDILDLFSINTFAFNVETYFSVLQMMISNGGQGQEWVKTMYNSLMNIGSHQSLKLERSECNQTSE